MPIGRNGFTLPDDFPHEPYSAVATHVTNHWDQSDIRSEFFVAWSAVEYRFRAFAASGAAFMENLNRHGTAPAPEQRYEQERDLFSFFVNGLSVFDCAYYAIFAVGALIAPENFPFVTEEERRDANTSATRNRFLRVFSNEEISRTLQSILNDPSYQDVRTKRNILAHRVQPGRHLYASFGGPPAREDEWMLGGEALTSLIPSRRVELTRLLTDLITTFGGFLLSPSACRRP